MNAANMLDGMPQTLVHGAEESAGRIAEAVESAGSRVARGAGLSARGAGLSARDAKLSIREKRLGMREQLLSSMTRRRRSRLLPSTDAMLKAQLVKTSRELAHESSDLNAAVDSLNKIVRSNRRTAVRARGRTRMLSGLALGAALMYHLDAEHGRERRAATAQLLTGMMRGQQPPATR